MEDMTEKLSNLDDNGDQLGKHLDLQSTQVTRERYFRNLNGVLKFTCQF